MKPVVVYPLIYVLELEENKWYVGITTNLNYRWGQHLSGEGAKWTRLHKPKRIVEIYSDNCDRKLEDEVTKKYVERYGRENVRGGSWTKCDSAESE